MSMQQKILKDTFSKKYSIHLRVVIKDSDVDMEDITAIKVVYAELPPFVEILSVDGKETLGGFMPAMFQAVILWMNLTATWIREPEDKYGTWENDTWTGMCGMLFRNEVDAIVNPLLPDDNYAKVCHYTNPILYESYTFLSGKEIKDGGLFLYFSVLEPPVWNSIGLSLIAITIASALLFLRLTFGNKSTWLFAVGQYLWVYVVYMLRQALNERWMFRASKIPIATLMPFLVILWIIGVSFLVMTVFQSLLVSKLTIVKAQPVVDSATDLITKKNVLGWTVPEIELQEVLKDSGIPAYEKLWDKLEPEMTTEDVLTDKYIKQVEKGKAAIVHGQLIMRNGLSEYFKEHGKCNLHVSSNVIYPFPLLVALRKSLSKEFVEKFNAGLTRLIAADISGKWFKPVFQASNLCTSYSDNELKPLELKNILGVIVIWCFGIATSILCFIVEICFNKKIQ